MAFIKVTTLISIYQRMQIVITDAFCLYFDSLCILYCFIEAQSNISNITVIRMLTEVAFYDSIKNASSCLRILQTWKSVWTQLASCAPCFSQGLQSSPEHKWDFSPGCVIIAAAVFPVRQKMCREIDHLPHYFEKKTVSWENTLPYLPIRSKTVFFFFISCLWL